MFLFPGTPKFGLPGKNGCLMAAKSSNAVGISCRQCPLPFPAPTLPHGQLTAGDPRVGALQGLRQHGFRHQDRQSWSRLLQCVRGLPTCRCGGPPALAVGVLSSAAAAKRPLRAFFAEVMKEVFDSIRLRQGPAFQASNRGGGGGGGSGKGASTAPPSLLEQFAGCQVTGTW